jgi:hypothetical protein
MVLSEKIKRGIYMRLFQRKSAEKRTLEDILKSKVVDEETTNSEIKSESNVESESAETGQTETVEPVNVKFNALSCFGWKEDKTEKWLIKCANVWYIIASFLWFIFGAITFAPVIFIQNKVNVLFNDKKKSLICAVIIYAVFVALIVLMFATRSTPQETITT